MPAIQRGFLLAVAVVAAGLWLPCAAAERGPSRLPRLKVSPEHPHYLVTAEGNPFFWLGDTSWAMLEKIKRETEGHVPGMARYFDNRRQKRFNVLQVRVVGDSQGKNAYDQPAFVDGDFTRPAILSGPKNDYWDMADDFADEAEKHGIYLAWLPIWLSSIGDNDPLVKDPKVAYRYGYFLGGRYRQRTHIVWVLGGDPYGAGRDVDHLQRMAMIRAMAEGIADGTSGVDNFDGQADYSTTLMTFHPRGGGHSSSRLLHNEPWLDFNMIQTTTRFRFTNYETVAADYRWQPPKPTLDAEVAYEASLSLSKDEPKDRRTTPWEARKAAYWNVFAGGLGHTYGHRSFISFVRDGETLRHGAHIPWYQSLDAPGSFQMTHLRNLMESRPILLRVPDQSIIAAGEGEGLEHVQATRASDGSYAMLYLPTGRPVTVRMEKISGKLSGGQVKAWWFDPREGKAEAIGEFPASGTHVFTPPAQGEGNDWVLVLDDASHNFPAPGQVGQVANLPQVGQVANLPEARQIGNLPHAYFPPPDSQGGWRTLRTAEEIRRVAGMDAKKLDEAFAVAEASTKNGGLLVVRNGWLVHEKYFGRGHRDATPNLASCGKSFTSIAVGILLAERPELFRDGLDTKIFTPAYLPPEAFPLSDPAKAEIKLGHLLTFAAGIRGNNPCTVQGKPVTIDPPGPDGWPSMVDAVALGKSEIASGGQRTSTAALWCKPGEGYSYASSSAHIASIMLRHVTGMELKDYVRTRLAEPLGWGRFTYAYRQARQVTHTPGGGGIAVRATDMLRFGYLLLRGGRWGDRQLVPAEYVAHCGRQSPYNLHAPYSLQFDVNSDGHVAEYPRDAFWKSGSGAHMIYIVPSLDLVVWKLAGRDSQYEQSDTGIPLAPEIAQGSQSRKNWKPTIEERAGQRMLLTKVIAAMVEPK